MYNHSPLIRSVSGLNSYLSLESVSLGFQATATARRSFDGSSVLGSPLSRTSMEGSSRGSPAPPSDGDEGRADDKQNNWVAPSGAQRRGRGGGSLGVSGCLGAYGRGGLPKSGGWSWVWASHERDVVGCLQGVSEVSQLPVFDLDLCATGPRQQGLGTEELEQGVISVEPSVTG